MVGVHLVSHAATLDGGESAVGTMRARVLVGAMTAGAAMLVVPTAAVAAPPVLNFVEEFEAEIVYDDLCEGPVTFSEAGRVFSRAFFNKDGSLARDTLHIRATTVWSSESTEALEHWAWAGTYDAESDTITERGNQWNVHVVGEGVVLNNSGLIKVGFGEEGPEIIKAAGPKDVTFSEGPPTYICDVLFP